MAEETKKVKNIASFDLNFQNGIIKAGNEGAATMSEIQNHSQYVEVLEKVVEVPKNVTKPK